MHFKKLYRTLSRTNPKCNYLLITTTIFSFSVVTLIERNMSTNTYICKVNNLYLSGFSWSTKNPDAWSFSHVQSSETWGRKVGHNRNHYLLVPKLLGLVRKQGGMSYLKVKLWKSALLAFHQKSHLMLHEFHRAQNEPHLESHNGSELLLSHLKKDLPIKVHSMTQK